MRCNEILSIEELERRAVTRDLVRGRDQITRRISESRCVQHLADVTSRLRSLGVMVQESDAGYDVKKHHAPKNGKHLAREPRREEPGC